MGAFIVVVVAPARQRIDGVPVLRQLCLDQPFLPVRPMEALDPTVRFGMRDPRPDVGEARSRDEQSPFAADELAAVIMDDVWFSRPP